MDITQNELLWLIGINALVALVSVPFILGRVPRNRFFGFRTPRTLASDAVWYPANYTFGKATALACLFGILAALISRFLDVTLSKGHALAFFCVVPIVAAGIYAFLALHRMPKTNENDADGDV